MHQSQHRVIENTTMIVRVLFLFAVLCAARYAFHYTISNVSVERRTLTVVCYQQLFWDSATDGCIDEWLLSRCHSPRTATRTVMPRGAWYRHVYSLFSDTSVSHGPRGGGREVRGSCRIPRFRSRVSLRAKSDTNCECAAGRRVYCPR